MTPALELDDLSKSFGDAHAPAVQSVSLSVEPGEIVSILGPSGCGKTTTMRMIAGLEKPTSGDIRIGGQSMTATPPHRRNIGLVFQSLAVFPHMTVEQNVAFGLRMRKTPKDLIPARVAQALDRVHLPPAVFAKRRPDQLSGGQLQRVAVARTIATEPMVMLFDEPMAALDRRLRDSMAVELRSIQKSLNIAAVYVTHDQETASMMSDRIVIMEAGRVVQTGTPSDIYQRPANRFVAEFLGELNSLNGVGAGRGQAGRYDVLLGGGRLQIAAPCRSGARLAMLVRPEHVSLHREPPHAEAVHAVVTDVQFASGRYRCALRLDDGQELSAHVPSGPERPTVGSDVWLQLDAETIMIEEGVAA